MVLAILALSGLLVSLYMLAYSMGLVGQLICGVGNCEAVQSSPYSRMGPVPVAAFGVLGYLVLMTLSLAGIQPGSKESKLIPLGLLGGGTVGVAFSAYLTYLEAFVIHAWCQWCVISAILMVLVMVAAIPEVKRIGGSK